jgi:hypothetical protein
MELKSSHLLRRPPNITPVSEFRVILPVFLSRPRSAEQLMMSRYDQLAKIVWSVVQSNPTRLPVWARLSSGQYGVFFLCVSSVRPFS